MTIYEAGSLLADGSIAPARRAFFGSFINRDNNATVEGRSTFENLVRWALGEIGNCPGGIGPSPDEDPVDRFKQDHGLAGATSRQITMATVYRTF